MKVEDKDKSEITYTEDTQKLDDSSLELTLRGDKNKTVEVLNKIDTEYERQGQEDKAIIAYREAVDSAAPLMNNLAWVYQKRGKTDESLPLAQVTVVMSPNSAGFIDTLAVILCKTEKRDKAWSCTPSSADNSNRPKIRYNALISPPSEGAWPWSRPCCSTHSASWLWCGDSSCSTGCGPTTPPPSTSRSRQPSPHNAHAPRNPSRSQA